MQRLKQILQKGISPILAIIVIIVVSVIVGAGFLVLFYFWQPVEPQEQPSVFGTEDELVGWETYRNEEYGFEIKYHGDWYIEMGSEYDFAMDPTAEILMGFQNYPPDEWENHGNKQLIFLGVNKATMIEWLEEVNRGSGWEVEEFTIDTRGGYKAISPEISISAAVEKNQYLYYLLIIFPDSPGEEVFNKMLSTFRFVE